jgi:O-antigen/teichoic acid export membrane protein
MVGTFAGIAGLGLGVAVTKRVAEFRSKDLTMAGEFASASIKIVVVGGTVAASIVVVGRDWLANAWLHSPDLATPLALAAGMVLTSALLGVGTGIFTGLEAFKQSAFANSLRAVLVAVLLVVGILIAGVNGALIGGVLAEGLTLMWVLPAVSRCAAVQGISVFGRRGNVGKPWHSLRRVALPALAASVSVLFSLLVGQRILAGQAGGFAAVGQFNVAYRWSMVVLFVPAAVSPVMLPVLSNLAGGSAHAAFRRLLRGNLVVLTLVTAIPALVMIAARQWVLGLSGSAYTSEPLIYVVLMISTIPIMWNTILSQAALALEAIRAWFVSDLVLSMVLIATAIVLVPETGALGLAVAYLVGYMATCAVLVLPVRARLGMLGSVS